MKNVIAGVLAWTLWIQTGPFQAPGEQAYIASYKTSEECTAAIKHFAATARETKAYKKIAFDNGSLRLEKPDGEIIAFSCLPDTVDPRKK